MSDQQVKASGPFVAATTGLRELEALSRELRRLVLETTHRAGMGYTGGSLSEADILLALYFKVLRGIDPDVYMESGEDAAIFSRYGLDVAGIAAAAKRLVTRLSQSGED